MTIQANAEKGNQQDAEDHVETKEGTAAGG